MTSFPLIWLGMAVSILGSSVSQQPPPAPDLREYKLAKLEIINADPLHSRALAEGIFGRHIGDSYDPQAIEEDLEQIGQMYDRLGFIDFRYISEIEHDPSQKTVSCVFNFSPGTQFFVNEINIEGSESGEKGIDAKPVIDNLLFKQKGIFGLSYFEHSKMRLGRYLESNGLSLKGFRYERSVDHPGTVDLFITIESIMK